MKRKAVVKESERGKLRRKEGKRVDRGRVADHKVEGLKGEKKE